MKNRLLSFVRRVSIQLAAAGFLLLGVVTLAQAQTFTVLHNFTNGEDGAVPYAGVTLDQVGRLYGTTNGATLGNGTVYRMVHQGGGWIIEPLDGFHDSDGARPESRVVFGPQGWLYGTTERGGSQGAGVIYDLHPSPTICRSVLCLWDEDVLHQMLIAQGYNLDYGDLSFDADGNVYGTAELDGGTCVGSPPGGGGGPEGNVYRLIKSNGVWSEQILWNFEDASSGAQPMSGVIRDAAGKLYGTTIACGDPQCNHQGTVFELTEQLGMCWAEQTLHAFAIDGSEGANPIAGLVMDAAGNFYGATAQKGPNGGGTIFELSPANGGWNFQVIYALTGSGYTAGPWRTLMMDSAGSLYGTNYTAGAFGYGSVFKLSHGSGGWTYTSLHDFSGSDGAYPLSNAVMDANGNLYGTASAGGTGSECQGGCGVVWEITP